MVFDIEHLKRVLIGLNAILLVVSVTCFILGCVMKEISNEAYAMIANYNITMDQALETDLSITFFLRVGIILMAFGLGLGALAILAAIAIWKHNMFTVKFVTAFQVIAVIVLVLVGLGTLIASESPFVNEDPKIALPLIDEQKSYIVDKYNCCYEGNCLYIGKQNCEEVIIRHVLKFCNIIAFLFLLGAVFHIITIVLMVYFLKALNELKKKKVKFLPRL